jgi:hypothetical protein
MGNEGKIHSYDLHESKLSLITSGRDRLGLNIIDVDQGDATCPKEELFGTADKLICDAPCSGLGVLGKKPDLRYKDMDSISELPSLQLKILSESEEAGVYAVSINEGKQIFITGHSEYDAETLNREYVRDKTAGLPIEVPKNYFPGDDDTQPPKVTWRSHANLLFSNWLNYFVYQTTPYDIGEINKSQK